MQRGPFVLGRYHCRQRLGSSPLGAVWSARIYGPAGFEKEFAVTILDGEIVEDALLLAGLVRPGWTLGRALKRYRPCLAPEVVGGGPVRPSSDVFSLGTILGRLVGSDAPAPLRALVRRATEPDPNLRHPSMITLRDALAPL